MCGFDCTPFARFLFSSLERCSSRLIFRVIWAFNRDNLTCTHALLSFKQPSSHQKILTWFLEITSCTENVRKDSMHVVMQGWTTRVWFSVSTESEDDHRQLPERSIERNTNEKQSDVVLYSKSSDRDGFIQTIMFQASESATISFPLWWCFTRIISMLLMVREIWNCIRSVHQSQRHEIWAAELVAHRRSRLVSRAHLNVKPFQFSEALPSEGEQQKKINPSQIQLQSSQPVSWEINLFARTKHSQTIQHCFFRISSSGVQATLVKFIHAR